MTNTKRTPDLSSDINLEKGTLILQFRHGQTLEMLVENLTEEIKTQALMHGLKQKLVDAAAISRNTETGRSATIQDKFDAVKEVYDRLLAGEWNKVRAGGGGGGGLLLQALIRLYPGKSKEDLETYLAARTKAEQAALRINPKIAPVIAEIQAERGQVDSDGLLAGLEDEEEA
jgi:hypothetical protein